MACDSAFDMIHEAAASLGYSSLKREQLQAIQAFMSGQDVFVSLPTGFGKSLCFGILPRLYDLKKFGTIEKKESIVIVVSPLKALMEDHVSSFTSKGISAGAITKESSFDTKQKARAGKFQLLFFSPESLLSGGHWRETLSQAEPFRSHVVAFIVDEAHCVLKWLVYFNSYSI